MIERNARRIFSCVGGLAVATIGAQVALAHPDGGVGHTHAVGGFGAGLAHPLTGLDHALAMLAVGLWAAQLGGRALWAVPAAFVAMMIVGAGLSQAGLQLPMVESGIVASIVVVGLCVAIALRPPVAAAAVSVALFAMFHGHAHGSELPFGASAATYAGGFAISTALIHAAGISLGFAIMQIRSQVALRIAGGAVALGGATLATL
ncbi:MAG: HupE/UreJ family protein [Phycisphaerae bacterium]